MIDAMPLILKSCPAAVYVILGATHPHLIRAHGEAYRESLMARAVDLGVAEQVIFLDRFVDSPTLLDFIAMCDVYVTPYLNAGQMTSGTLAYSFGLGKAVVSTPFWHARELLADGKGVLVPFGDATAIGAAVAVVLSNEPGRAALRARAYAASRDMTWDQSALRYIALFEEVRRGRPLALVPVTCSDLTAKAALVSSTMTFAHFLTMTDDTGLFQHAVHAVPDRHHGYCIDDNARALLLTATLTANGEDALPESYAARFASFVQHAWNPDTRRFRNFMSFERRWLEPAGSEDSHGRTLWALGHCARNDASASRRKWAAALFARALPTVESFTSPRAWGFTLLGLNAFCGAQHRETINENLRHELADRLIRRLSLAERPDWVWFESSLAYDNARLCQALIETGRASNAPAYTDAGLRTLRWLMSAQTAPQGHFRPVGSDSFGAQYQRPAPFDQQPVEAAATISACLAAFDANGDPMWNTHAARAFAWFIGRNDLGTALVDPETGACRDGLHPDRANENCGGESVWAYLTSVTEMRARARRQIDLDNPLLLIKKL